MAYKKKGLSDSPYFHIPWFSDHKAILKIAFIFFPSIVTVHEIKYILSYNSQL